ncbi:D-aminoacylase [soil metagenome]
MLVDFILREGTVIDGSGRERFKADVAIDGDRVLRVGDCTGLEARQDIDVRGLVVAPGFIDTHSHDDAEVLTRPDMVAKVSQGVTTVVVGNCGISAGPSVDIGMGHEIMQGHRFASFGDYVELLRAQPSNVNVAPLIGHTSLRGAVMRNLAQPASPQEVEAMRALLQDALQAGAIGVSTGTAYPPARAATTREIVDICEPLARHGGIFTTHMRDEAAGLLGSIDETGEIGSALGVRTLISHHKCLGVANHGMSIRSLEAVDRWRQRMPLAIDVYPYAATSTVLLPERVRASSRTQITVCPSHPDLIGRDVAEVAEEWGCTIEEFCSRVGVGGATYFALSEEDVTRTLAHPASMIGSDGVPAQERPHPRLWGTFPRVLGHYSRELGLFGLEAAVRKMTGLPADFFRMAERGRLEPGYFADVTVFSPDEVVDTATFDEPTRMARGIEYVFLNGQPTWRRGKIVAARPGRVLGCRPVTPRDDRIA